MKPVFFALLLSSFIGSAQAVIIPSPEAVMIDLTTAEATDVRGMIRSLDASSVSFNADQTGSCTTNPWMAGARQSPPEHVWPGRPAAA